MARSACTFGALLILILGCESTEERIAREIEALENGTPVKQAKAIEYLGKREVVEAIPALINTLATTGEIERSTGLKAPDPEWTKMPVQHLAAHALGEIGAPAVSPLIVAFESADDHWLRKGIVDALGYICGLEGDKRTIRPLITAMSDTEVEVRAEAATRVKIMWDKAEEEELRQEVWIAFERALQDEEAEVRLSALDAWDDFALERWFETLQYRPPLESRASAALVDTNEDVRMEAASVLRYLGSPTCVPALGEALRVEPSEAVRWHIVLAMRRIASEQAIPFLEAQLPRESSDRVIRTIRETLEGLNAD